MTRRACIAALMLLPASASAGRPTEGGLFAFGPDDVVLTHDHPDGDIRVHYTEQGPNAAPSLAYVTQVADTAVEALALYAGPLALRPPIDETELGPELGGSPAFDIYLVDFGGAADGHFLVDACDGPRCSGAFVMENDFAGYGYETTAAAIDTVVSHELFHAVQAAYDHDAPIWFSEGTAVWAERRFRSDSQDFIKQCDRYLADTGRTLFKPPSGPVPAFAYGTGLWWDFLISRTGDDLVEPLLIASEGDLLVTMPAAIAATGDDLASVWLEFVAANLATGPRAGASPGHAYAARLTGIGDHPALTNLDEALRIFALSANYYRLAHPGGPLWFALDAPAPPLQFALHPVEASAADGPVLPAVLQWDATEVSAHELADLPAGGYWLSIAHPEIATTSTQTRLCLGDEPTARLCDPTTEPDPEPAPTEPAAQPDPEPEPPPDEGCDCRTSNPPFSLLGLLLLPRRRRPPGLPVAHVSSTTRSCGSR